MLVNALGNGRHCSYYSNLQLPPLFSSKSLPWSAASGNCILYQFSYAPNYFRGNRMLFSLFLNQSFALHIKVWATHGMRVSQVHTIITVFKWTKRTFYHPSSFVAVAFLFSPLLYAQAQLLHLGYFIISHFSLNLFCTIAHHKNDKCLL